MLPVCDLDGGIPEGCLCVKDEENVETAELDMQLKTGKLDFEKLNEELGLVFVSEYELSLRTHNPPEISCVIMGNTILSLMNHY